MVKKNRTGANSSGWKGGKIERICKQCDVKFEVHPSQIKIGEGIFCSLECHRKWQSENKKKRKNKTKMLVLQ